LPFFTSWRIGLNGLFLVIWRDDGAQQEGARVVQIRQEVAAGRPPHAARTHLQLGVGPARDLDDHVHNAIGFVGEERDVVERRDDLALLVLCRSGQP